MQMRDFVQCYKGRRQFEDKRWWISMRKSHKTFGLCNFRFLFSFFMVTYSKMKNFKLQMNVCRCIHLVITQNMIQCIAWYQHPRKPTTCLSQAISHKITTFCLCNYPVTIACSWTSYEWNHILWLCFVRGN